MKNQITSCESCRPVELKKVKKGEFVKRSATSAKVYRKSDYDPSSKKYSIEDCEDTNREMWLPGKTVVFVDFTY